eukprot:320447-Chlamydomonas_euryale.AAC.9
MTQPETQWRSMACAWQQLCTACARQQRGTACARQQRGTACAPQQRGTACAWQQRGTACTRPHLADVRRNVPDVQLLAVLDGLRVHDLHACVDARDPCAQVGQLGLQYRDLRVTAVEGLAQAALISAIGVATAAGCWLCQAAARHMALVRRSVTDSRGRREGTGKADAIRHVHVGSAACI